MKNDAFLSLLRESSWRRKLTEAEQAELRAYLAAHPDARADWEMESALNAALTRLPDAPVPSNFTARVLQAVEREAVRPPGLELELAGAGSSHRLCRRRGDIDRAGHSSS